MVLSRLHTWVSWIKTSVWFTYRIYMQDEMIWCMPSKVSLVSAHVTGTIVSSQRETIRGAGGGEQVTVTCQTVPACLRFCHRQAPWEPNTGRRRTLYRQLITETTDLLTHLVTGTRSSLGRGLIAWGYVTPGMCLTGWFRWNKDLLGSCFYCTRDLWFLFWISLLNFSICCKKLTAV